MTDRGYKLHEGLHGVQVLGVIKFGGVCFRVDTSSEKQCSSMRNIKQSLMYIIHQQFCLIIEKGILENSCVELSNKNGCDTSLVSNYVC